MMMMMIMMTMMMHSTLWPDQPRTLAPPTERDSSLVRVTPPASLRRCKHAREQHPNIDTTNPYTPCDVINAPFGVQKRHDVWLVPPITLVLPTENHTRHDVVNAPASVSPPSST